MSGSGSQMWRGAASGALDVEEFKRTWAASAWADSTDTFAPGWDLWAVAAQEWVWLRERWRLQHRVWRRTVEQ